MKKYLLMPALFLLSACDPTGVNTFYIQNNSSSKIYWYKYTNPVAFGDSIAAGEKKIVFEDHGIGGGGPVPEGTGELKNYNYILRIINEDSVELKKDFSTRSSWAENRMAKRVADYSMEISDTDF